MYNNVFRGLSWIQPLASQGHSNSAFHIYVVLINFKKIQKSRGQVMDYLKMHNIGTQVHYIPVYTHPYYRKILGLNPKDYPFAESYYKAALTLPLYQDMIKSDVNRVINKVLSLSS